MPAFPFVGPAYRARSVNFDGQRCLNLFPELSQSGTSKSVAALYGTPGLRLWSTLPTNAVRGLLRFSESVLIAVAGNAVYSVTTAGVATQVGEIGAGTTPVSMASNGTDVMIVTGTQGYTYRPATNAFAAITDPDFVGADVVFFIDGYFVMNKPGTGQFYITQLYGTSIDGLDFATAEGSPDILVSLLVDHRELWLFGEVSTEIWFNSGSADFPFERNQGAYLEVGCAAKYSPAKMDNVVYWLGRDGSGQGIVYRAQGYQPQRVSDYGVEYAIGQMSRIDDAIGFSYQQEGHHFYMLTFPTARQTWVFDANTAMWHERAYWDAATATFDRHRSNCAAAFANRVIVGDWANGKLYSFDMDYYTDDGDTIRRVRSCPHLNADMKYQFFNSLQIDMEAGVGLSGDPELDPPTPILLDTFTAADGTLTVARSMDAVPSGWPTTWVGGVDYWASDDDAGGSIQTNSMRNARPTYTDAYARYAKTSGVTPGDFGSLPAICSAFPVVIFMDAEVTGGSGSTNATFSIAAAGSAGSSALQLTLKDNGLATIYAQGETGGDGLPEFALSVGRHKLAVYVTATGSSSIADGVVVGTWGDIGSALTYNVMEAIISSATGDKWINEVAVYQGITLSEAIALTA
jgi:hypothetical protein